MNIKVKPLPDANKIQDFASLLTIHPLLAALLMQRGYDNFDKAKTFFRPNLSDLHDPFLMKNMDKAIFRIEKAIANNQKILVYGDYDVDGTTAVALVYSFLSKYYSNIDFYVPDRYDEGYGISTKSIDYAKSNEILLIIALDCGIKSVDKVLYANSLGIDYIICDHHEPGSEIPDAVAVLDAKQADCNYPFKELSGCGVGFKLMQAFCIKKQIDIQELYPFLDLLCISIGADLVPIVGENRIFCYYGLRIINQNPRFGIQALIKVSGYKKALNITDVVFKLAPRINAAGRIHHASAAVKLLLSPSVADALVWATSLNDSNAYRKELDTTITEEAKNMIESQENYQNLRSTVLFKPDWSKGVVGIVASRCIESYYKPTIILTESNGLAVGSARSVHGFDLYEAISACSAHLEQFGGHTHAAGMALKIENITPFKIAFEEYVSKNIHPDSIQPKLDIDMEVNLDFITPKTYRIIEQMAPFGPQNMTPVFLTKNLKDTGYSRIVGDVHLKLDIVCPLSNIKIAAIAFNQANMYAQIKSDSFAICYTLEQNEYNNIVSLQLNVKKIIIEN